MVPSSPPVDPCLVGRVIARAAMVVLLAGAALAAQVPARFSLGDARERVRQVQGAPDLIERLTSQGVEHWSYDGASVTFDATSGRVVEWNDVRGALRIALRPAHDSRDSALTLGAPLTEVARMFGTPWAITRDVARRQMY